MRQERASRWIPGCARAVAVVALGAAVAALVRGWRPAGCGRARRGAHSVARRARFRWGRVRALRYRMAGSHPNPDVDDHTLSDRVRSTLGPLEHRLDIPHVHVQAQGHEVLLHGDVSSDEQTVAIEEAVRRVPGVGKVSSHLHVGLFPGDTRPSEGGHHAGPSEGLAILLAAAHGAGAPEGSEPEVVSSVLSAFMELLPTGERRHVVTHLAADVRALVPAHGRFAARAPAFVHVHRPALSRRPRHVADFALDALPTLDPASRELIVRSVVGALRDLVPEEVADVGAVLPRELRDLWKTAVPL